MEPDRFSYSPIVERPRIEWPNGCRLALWVVPNIEHYEYLPRIVGEKNPWPRVPHPDVLSYATRDYGNRVGVWRMFDVMDKHELRGTVSLSISVIDHFPEIFEAMEARCWDYLCHGVYNTRYLFGLSEDDERAVMADCLETYRRATGRQLPGWFGPASSCTLNTPDLVAEMGFKYCTDWYHDDQPCPMKVRSGRLITVPYAMDINDAIEYRHPTEGAEFARMIRDHFDTLYRESETSGRVMCIALHPYIMGQPHRIKHLDEALGYVLSHDGVWKATGEEIADWYYAHYYEAFQQHLGAEA
jgi:peptidoglycan/xylan/chitin deacetylase (PgdA/CDA1 family)